LLESTTMPEAGGYGPLRCPSTELETFVLDAVLDSARPALRRLHIGYSWLEIERMDRRAAARELARQYTRQRDTWTATIARLIVLAALAIGSAIAWNPVLGPLASIAAVLGGHAAVQFGQRLWVHRTIGRLQPPLGRMQAVIVMLTRSKRGGGSRSLVEQLLTNGPAELSCSALGRHTKGYCPHAAVAW
jgi:hypothetical protein